ncbi:MAG: TonB-dependent receptor [Fermentimonas sp.]|jgi:iron complex outermembrane receptor protein
MGLFLVTSHRLYSQSSDDGKRISVSGYVHDSENKSYLPYATVGFEPSHVYLQTDSNGFFSIDNLPPSNYTLTVRYVGYDELVTPLLVTNDTILHLHLTPIHSVLNEIVVSAKKQDKDDDFSALAIVDVNKDYLQKNNSNNFVQTIAKIAGVSSMDIGAGYSKPMIRGMGFNRIAVVDKGIVQQNQQWGADHGLDIDQYDVDRVRVHKGPMSMLYGSDAIGGVIEVMNPVVPKENMTWGDVSVVAKSNNELLGTSVMLSSKSNHFYVKGRATLLNYGDYRIPTDTINYLTWKMPVYGRRMKNTAGRESNISFSVNYEISRFNSTLHVSNINSKNGFYPGAHGIPMVSRLNHDGSYRNVDKPYYTSNHFKVISNSLFMFNNNDAFELDLGYQNNHREEVSEFHTHYSNQKPPLINPDLELKFVLDTYSANLRFVGNEKKRWSKSFGVSSEYQKNSVGGYSFLLPDFDRLSLGIFWLNRINVSDRLTISNGLRYDFGRLKVEGFYDAVLDEYLTMHNYEKSVVEFNALRSEKLKNKYSNLSGSVGLDYYINKNSSLKINAGNSFRYPGANELASNGVHHGAFRHEKGNSELKPELGYQLDADYSFVSSNWQLRINTFVTWFTNYIFLEPTGEWSVLPHAGQIYRYNQSKAFMTGGELMIDYGFYEKWRASSAMEYVYNINLTDDYPLPFSPPSSIVSSITYNDSGRGMVGQYILGVENRAIFAQNRIARNEDTTPGTVLWNLMAQVYWHAGKHRFVSTLRVDNIFDKAYFNHLSFYRKLNAPEPGRNVHLAIKYLF